MPLYKFSRIQIVLLMVEFASIFGADVCNDEDQAHAVSCYDQFNQTVGAIIVDFMPCSNYAELARAALALLQSCIEEITDLQCLDYYFVMISAYRMDVDSVAGSCEADKEAFRVNCDSPRATLMEVSYDACLGTPLTCGQELQLNPCLAANKPRVKFPPSHDVPAGTTYFILMLDLDIDIERDTYVHWVEQSIDSTQLGNVQRNSLTTGTQLVPYQQPNPPSGVHRYTIIVIEQFATIGPPDSYIYNRVMHVTRLTDLLNNVPLFGDVQGATFGDVQGVFQFKVASNIPAPPVTEAPWHDFTLPVIECDSPSDTLLEVSLCDTALACNQQLDLAPCLMNKPIVKFPSSYTFSAATSFIMMMLDPHIEVANEVYIHWAQQRIEGEELDPTLSNRSNTGFPILTYEQPNPPTGKHQYLILVFEQLSYIPSTQTVLFERSMSTQDFTELMETFLNSGTLGDMEGVFQFSVNSSTRDLNTEDGPLNPEETEPGAGSSEPPVDENDYEPGAGSSEPPVDDNGSGQQENLSDEEQNFLVWLIPVLVVVGLVVIVLIGLTWWKVQAKGDKYQTGDQVVTNAATTGDQAEPSEVTTQGTIDSSVSEVTVVTVPSAVTAATGATEASDATTESLASDVTAESLV